MEANWNHSWSHFKICNFSCPVRKTSTINALCLWPFWQGSMDVPHQKIQQFNAMFTMSSCIYPIFLLGLGNGKIQSPATAQMHWWGTQPFTQVVDKLTTAHLEDEMHRRFLLHLVRISGKCTNGKSQTKTYNGQDPRSKVGLWKTSLVFFCPPSFQRLC